MTTDTDKLLALCEASPRGFDGYEMFRNAANPAAVKALILELKKAEAERDAAKAIIVEKRSPEWADQAIAFDLAAARADKAEDDAKRALATADGYREYSDRVEAERDALKADFKAEEARSEMHNEARKTLKAELATARETALETYLARQILFSTRAFGPGRRTLGIVKHIRKELEEILAKPDDLTEWIDVVILAIDGFWRNGGAPGDLSSVLFGKLATNEARTWPEPTSEDEPIEHVRALAAKEK